MQSEPPVLPVSGQDYPREEPKKEKKKEAGTLGELLTFITKDLGTTSPMPDRVTKKGKMIFYHEPGKRRAKHQTQRHSRQVNARKAKG
jgi:hypothetical protein